MKTKHSLIITILSVLQLFDSGSAKGAALPIIAEPYGESRPRTHFVHDILNTTEEVFAEWSPKKQLAHLKDMQTRGFHYGNLSLPSLNELRTQYKAAKAASGKKKAGSFYVIVGKKPLENPLVYQQVDTGSLQAHWGLACQQTGKRLTVMVASNSNGLETTSYTDIPSNISRYIHDKTQGPAASISAAPGTLFRNYFAFYDEDNDSKDLPWRQNKDQQINFLEGILNIVATNHGIEIPMSNGYLAFRKQNLSAHLKNTALLNAIADTFEATSDAIQVGVHTDVTVSHGLCEGKNHRFLTNPAERSLINQVFCAGLDLGQGTNPNTIATRRIAKILLAAQVEATIRAAYLNNTDIVVLSMLGCGAFGNEPEWLIHAIEQCQELIQESGMRVVLNLFSGERVIDNDALRTRLITLAETTGGAFLQYSQEASTLMVENLCAASTMAKASESCKLRSTERPSKAEDDDAALPLDNQPGRYLTHLAIPVMSTSCVGEKA